MSEFTDREKAFERKFELDEEIKFKIDSRSAHLFGMWAAEQLGLKGSEAESYAKQALDLIVSKTGRLQLAKKVEQDLKAKGRNLSQHIIEKEMEDFYLKAREQIAGAGKS